MREYRLAIRRPKGEEHFGWPSGLVWMEKGRPVAMVVMQFVDLDEEDG